MAEGSRKRFTTESTGLTEVLDSIFSVVSVFSVVKMNRHGL
jgi:hypothetical protein